MATNILWKCSQKSKKKYGLHFRCRVIASLLWYAQQLWANVLLYVKKQATMQDSCYFKCSNSVSKILEFIENWNCFFFSYLWCQVGCWLNVKLNYYNVFPNKIKACCKLAWCFQRPTWHFKTCLQLQLGLLTSNL